MHSQNVDYISIIFDSSTKIDLWQAVVVIVFGAVAFAIAHSVLFGLRWLIRHAFAKSALHSFFAPSRLALAAIIFTLTTRAINLSPEISGFLRSSEKALTFFTISWFIFSSLNVISAWLTNLLMERRDASILSIISLGRRAAKMIVLVIATLMVLQNWGIDTTAFLAAFGIGGIAIALAGQKTVENLVGGIMIVLDQPVRVGDTCRFDHYEGVVEDIGIRSTRIRTPEHTIVSIPNSEFAQLKIENLAPSDRKILRHTFRVRQTTLENIQIILAELNALLRNHPKIDAPTASVHVVNMSNLQVQIDIMAFVWTTDAEEFLAIREEILLQKKAIIDSKRNIAASSQQYVL